MNKAIIWLMVALMAFVLCGEMALAGSGTTNAPAAPGSANSAMWTLNDIYNVLNTRTTNVAQRTSGFTEPSAGPTNGNMYTLNDIMALVTNRAPVAKTGQTSTLPATAAWGSDGYLQIGVIWPANRFSIQSDTNVVLDNFTGLMWTRNTTNYWPRMTWTNALIAVSNMNNNVGATNYGYADWRMPNIRELTSVFDYGHAPVLPSGHPFGGTLLANLWTSTTRPDLVTSAIYVYLYNGIPNTDSKATGTYSIWPVRGGGQ